MPSTISYVHSRTKRLRPSHHGRKNFKQLHMIQLYTVLYIHICTYMYLSPLAKQAMLEDFPASSFLPTDAGQIAGREGHHRCHPLALIQRNAQAHHAACLHLILCTDAIGCKSLSWERSTPHRTNRISLVCTERDGLLGTAVGVR
jgi:hypothetical protein